jgi:hypothetical protein
VRVATFNINNINKRLDNLLAWLAKAEPDVVSLQETPGRAASLSCECPSDSRARSGLARGGSLGARTPSTRLGRSLLLSPLKWTHCIGQTLAISESAFSAHFNLENRLARRLVVNDLDITELKAPCLIRPQPGIAREKDIVMQLLRLPFEALFLRLQCAFSSRFTEFLVFFWRKPGPAGAFDDRRYGSEKSGSRSSHPWHSAVFRVWRSVTISCAWCCVPAACRVSRLLVDVCELDIRRFFPG